MKYGETAEKRDLAHAQILALDEVLRVLRGIQSEGEHAEKVIELRRKEDDRQKTGWEE